MFEQFNFLMWIRVLWATALALQLAENLMWPKDRLPMPAPKEIWPWLQATLLLITLPLTSLFPEWWRTCLILILILQWLRLRDWGGVQNGGSDMITTNVGLGLFMVGDGHNVIWLHAGLLWIGLQGLSSYWRAGWVKLRSPEWRNGSALKEILDLHCLFVPKAWSPFVQRHGIWICWTVILWELLSVLSLLSPQIALIFAVSAVVFHFLNSRILGLTRFFWAWLPAILGLVNFSVWCSKNAKGIF